MGDVIALIPAKERSRRLPGKNMLPLNGKPLFIHSVEMALLSERVDQVVVSSDSTEILKQAMDSGAIGLRRPGVLCGDHVPNFAVCRHVAEVLKEQTSHVEYIVLMQPTNPFRTVEGLDCAIDTFLKKPAFDSLASVKKIHRLFGVIHSDEWMSSQRQPGERARIKEDLFEITGHLFIMRVSKTVMRGTLLGSKVFAWPIPEDWIDVDIDTPIDFLIAKSIVSHGYHLSKVRRRETEILKTR
jgi:CMP-N-acetylneuraminic acid synthetase